MTNEPEAPTIQETDTHLVVTFRIEKKPLVGREFEADTCKCVNGIRKVDMVGVAPSTLAPVWVPYDGLYLLVEPSNYVYVEMSRPSADLYLMFEVTRGSSVIDAKIMTDGDIERYFLVHTQTDVGDEVIVRHGWRYDEAIFLSVEDQELLRKAVRKHLRKQMK